jgi:hypothetical protein
MRRFLCHWHWHCHCQCTGSPESSPTVAKPKGAAAHQALQSVPADATCSSGLSHGPTQRVSLPDAAHSASPKPHCHGAAAVAARPRAASPSAPPPPAPPPPPPRHASNLASAASSVRRRAGSEARRPHTTSTPSGGKEGHSRRVLIGSGSPLLASEGKVPIVAISYSTHLQHEGPTTGRHHRQVTGEQPSCSAEHATSCKHVVAHTELCVIPCHMQPMHTKPHHHLGFGEEWSPQKASKQASERSECTTDMACTWYSWVQ